MAVERAPRRRDGKDVLCLSVVAEEGAREAGIDILIPGRSDPAAVHAEIAAGPAEYGGPRRRLQRNIRTERRCREQDRQRCHACDQFVHWKSPVMPPHRRDSARELYRSRRHPAVADWPQSPQIVHFAGLAPRRCKQGGQRRWPPCRKREMQLQTAGSIPRSDRRLTPQEPVVQAHARHVLFELQPGVDGELTRKGTATSGRGGTKRLVMEVTQIKEEIFRLERPVIAERIFEAAAGGPAQPPNRAIASEMEPAKEEAIGRILNIGFALDVAEHR